MYIYNSLTNKKEEFKTIEPNKVKMYVCGPTVYNFIHIGNARPVIFFDVVRRYLEYKGYEVTYVSNITDVDDKIINAAIENNVTEEELASKYTKAFLDDVRNLKCVPFDKNPRVVDYMSEIIDFIVKLQELGYAYEVDGDVYFSVNKIVEYGQLSNQETENLEVGARVTEHSKKQNPLDFTLWKKTTVGIKWDSPWGKGRPGWHTECVAMINDTIGKVIDIHGGGSDLKFPHHENEIAQSVALNNTKLANYWMHNGRLMINDEKMSKSIGNIITINQFINKYDYRVLRLFMLSTHYRQPINYSEDIIINVSNDIEKIYSTLKQVQYKLDLHNFLDYKGSIIDEYKVKFEEEMDDDFNTANGISIIMSIIKDINKITRLVHYNNDDFINMYNLYYTLKTFLKIYGIDYDIARLDDETKELIHLRDEARKNKDFEKSDMLRAKLLEKGINI